MKLSELLSDRDRLRNRLTVPVLMSTDHAEACAVAQNAVNNATKKLERAERAEEGRMAKPRTDTAREELQTAQADLDAANEAARDHLVDFVVESIGSDAWEELVSQHPPTKDQREVNGDAQFNPSTFPRAAVAACLVSPEVDTLEDVDQLRAHVPDVVWQQIFAAVMRVNRGANRVPLSLIGSAATKTSAGGSGQRSS